MGHAVKSTLKAQRRKMLFKNQDIHQLLFMSGLERDRHMLELDSARLFTVKDNSGCSSVWWGLRGGREGGGEQGGVPGRREPGQVGR